MSERVLITLKKGLETPHAIIKRLHLDSLFGVVVEPISKRILIFECIDKSCAEGLRDRIRSDSDVLRIEVDETATVADLDDEGSAYYPRDPLYEKQWGLLLTGVASVWKQGYTGKGQTIAIIDSGIDFTHPEFGGTGDKRINANLHPNTILRMVDPILRDIRNDTHVKIAPGYNFVDGNDNTFDFHRHGTSVASQAAAFGNDVGMIGAAPDALIAPYKVLNQRGNGSISNIVAALGRIIEEGTARIVSISLVFPTKPMALAVITEEAKDAGILVMAAVGNDNKERSAYPASDPNVLSIGGCQRGRKRWTVNGALGSNWPCDILGPAAAMPTALKWRGRYTDHQGTSLASPHIAGIAALCLEAWPEAPLEVLRSAILYSGDKVTNQDPYYGFGCVNAPRALASILTEKGDTSVDKNQYLELKEIYAEMTIAIKHLEAWYEKYGRK